MTNWKIVEQGDPKRAYISIVDEDGGAICQIFPFAGKGGVGLEKARENARKIVNADQLWDALNDLVDWCEEGCPHGGTSTLIEACAALKMIRLEPV